LDFRPKPEDVPPQGIGDAYRPIGKPMQFLNAELASIPRPRHHPPALRTEIDPQINLFIHQCMQDTCPRRGKTSRRKDNA